MTSPAPFRWSDSYLLGYPPMDETHREFVEIVGRLAGSDPATVVERLESFASHAEKHFAEERGWMTTTDFPAAQCHIDEHDAVTKSLREVIEVARAGNTAIVEGFAKALIDWFPGHAVHMDSALSHWMVKREYGGKPVVLRRDVAKPR